MLYKCNLNSYLSSLFFSILEHASYAKYTKAEKENKKNKEKVTMLRVKENKYKKDISFSKQTSKTISILLKNVKDFIEANDKLIQYGSVSDTF
jgi:acetate kinase